MDDINGLSQEFISQIELDDEELKHCAKCETLSSTIEELQIELQEKDEKFKQPNREIKRFKRLGNERRTIFFNTYFRKTKEEQNRICWTAEKVQNAVLKMSKTATQPKKP